MRPLLRRTFAKRKSIFLAGVLLGGGFGATTYGGFLVAIILFSLSALLLILAGFRSRHAITPDSGVPVRVRPQATLPSWVISNALDPIRAIEALWVLGKFSNVGWWLEFFEDLKNCYPEALDHLIDRRHSLTIIELKFLVELAKAELGPRFLSNEEMRPVIDLAVQANVLSAGTISVSANRLATVLLKEQSGRLLRQSLPVIWSSTSETTKLRVLERFAMVRDISDYEHWKAQYEPDNPMNRMRVEAFDGYVFKTGEDRYNELRKTVLNSDSKIAEIYKLQMVPLEQKLAKEQNFLHSGWLRPSENPLFQRLRMSLEQKTSMGFLRVGDGEAYGFDDNPFLFDEGGRDRQEKHWWGQAYDASARRREISAFRSAVRQADILGIPTLGRLVRNGSRSYNPNSASSRTIHATTEVLRMAATMPRQAIVDVWSIYDLLMPDVFADLIGAAQACVVISGHRREFLEPIFQDSCPVTFLEIPAHAQERGSHIANEVGGTTLQAIDEVGGALASGLAHPGVLVLISAGFGGKKLVSHAVVAGAVGVDVGQALFRMATRGTPR